MRKTANLMGFSLWLLLWGAWPAQAQAPAAAPRATAASQFKTTYQMLAKADAERDNGRLREAAKLYRDALFKYARLAKKYPDWQSGVVKFRMIYCDNQLNTLMKEMKDKGINPINRGVPEGNVTEIKRRARRLLSEKKLVEARQELLEGLRLNPDDTTVRLLIAVGQCQAGEFTDAMYLLKSLIEDAPRNADARVVLAIAYFALDRPKDACKELENALKIEPTNKEAHYNMAQILLETRPRDRAAAKAHYRRAVELGTPPDKKLEALLNK